MPASQEEVIRIRGDKPTTKLLPDMEKIYAAKTQEEVLSLFSGIKKQQKKVKVTADKKGHEVHTTELSAPQRDAMVALMESKSWYPETWTHERELKLGLYPDIQDPSFGAQLYNKLEFYETRAAAISALHGTDPCSDSTITDVFEKSPTQRFIARFMNPVTPYLGMLLYHGVGVGKTCTAISVAEEYLRNNPYSKVYIIVPGTISSGFHRTIFDPTKLKKVNGQWTSKQCTDMIYPEMALQELAKKEKKDDTDYTVDEIYDVIQKKIRERYFRLGYLQFAHVIEKLLKAVPSHLSDAEKTQAENELLAKHFSDKLIIIDEAHNLRDAVRTRAGVVAGAAAAAKADAAEEEVDLATDASDREGGKQLTPLLDRIVLNARGLRLLLMTATPMYNRASEIADLLNLLILNDTKDESKIIKNIFEKDGNLKEDKDKIIRGYAKRYVSYMRGENPYTFPLRLRPLNALPIKWSTTQKVGDTEKPIKLSTEDQNILKALPLIHVVPKVGSAIHNNLMSVLQKGNPEDFKAETWVHLDICNIVYPNGYYGNTGWDSYFSEASMAGDGLKYIAFQWKGAEDDEGINNIDDIFGKAKLANYAPKMAAIVNKISESQGISFVYSRYVKAGILPLAIALEREGYTRVFNSTDARPVYAGKDARVPRQCAFCQKKENTHGAKADHTFTPACYVMLTGQPTLTPNFSETLNYASRWGEDVDALQNPYGKKVKVILGSQITTEGLDLKCIRSIHIMDPWYHLNRLEQIIGRGIRYCSHSDLPVHLRNCLVYMYALTLTTPSIETPDLHAYRISVNKAKSIGKIQRLMKESALDCNLNLAGLIVRGAPPRKVMDATGKVIETYDINDSEKSFSSTCDYMDKCEYSCEITIPKAILDKPEKDRNTSTYTFLDAGRRLAQKEAILKGLFYNGEVAIAIKQVQDVIYKDLPWEITSRALAQILENPTFIIEQKNGMKGRLILRNGYLLFQPIGVRSKEIPMAYRHAKAYGVLPRKSIIPKRGSILGAVDSLAPPVADGEEPAGAPAAAAAAAAAKTSDPVETYIIWMAAVDKAIKLAKTGAADTIKLWNPPLSEKLYQLKPWGWLLFHFRNVPEIRIFASDFWVDRAWTPNERKAVLERIIREGAAKFPVDMINSLKKDMFKFGETAGFKWVNTENAEPVESVCLEKGQFGICPTSYEKLIAGKMDKPIDFKSGTGNWVGFLIPRKDKTIVFKTLDKSTTKKYTGALGSDCTVASDLGGHRGRVREIQNLVKSLQPDLAPLMMDDTLVAGKATDKTKRKGQQEVVINHIDDFSHLYICIYIEALLKILDAKKSGGVRWYLNAVEGARAGLKGR